MTEALEGLVPCSVMQGGCRLDWRGVETAQTSLDVYAGGKCDYSRESR